MIEDRVDSQASRGRLKENENFFAKFGVAEETKQKLKTELHEDYLRFKLLDEQRFKNRFAHKKALDVGADSNLNMTYPVGEVSADHNAKLENKPRQVEPKVLIAKTSNNTEQLDQKLHNLEQKIEEIRNETSACLPITSENKSIYEGGLIQRMKLIQEAEGRINKIDDEYTMIKESITENEGNNVYGMKHSDHRTTSAVTSLKPETTKYSMQHNYRKELENQIRDSLERRRIQNDQAKAGEKHFGVLQDRFKHNHLGRQLPTAAGNHTGHHDGLQQTDHPLDIPSLSLSGNGEQVSNILGQHQNSFSFTGNTSDASMHMKLKKAQYAQDLMAQIEESRLKKEIEKRREEEYDKKIEESCKEQKPVTASNNVDMRDVKYIKTEENHARGGHGIFGSPLTVEQKLNLQRYKEELANQITEKQRLIEEERRREMDKERQEEERLRNQQLKIQAEYEEEQRRLQVKRDHFENSLIPVKREANTQVHIEACENDRDEKQTFDEVSMQKECKRFKGHSKLQKHSCSTTNNTPELLIVTEQAKGDVNEPKKVKRKQSINSNGTQAILQQLKSMRNKLEEEKVRVEEVIATRKAKTVDRDSPVGQSKPLPRVGKRGTQLFGILNHGRSGETKNTQLSTKDPVSKQGNDWLSEALWDERIVQLDRQQQACLSIQNDYIRELKHFPAPNSLKIEDSNEIKLPTTVSRGDADCLSEGSIDVEEIAIKNEQRNRKLETIQLLNNIGREPELVLERFLTKHDAAFDANLPMM